MWRALVRHCNSTQQHTAWQLLQSSVEAVKGGSASSSNTCSVPLLAQAQVMPATAFITNMATADMAAERDQSAGRPCKRTRLDTGAGNSAPRPAGPASLLKEAQTTSRTPISALPTAADKAAAAQLASKSAKRKAAEALLALRFSNNSSSVVSDSGASSGSQQGAVAGTSGASVSISSGVAGHQQWDRWANQAAQPSSSLVVAACDSSCAHHLAHGWCHQEARLPHVDWTNLLLRPVIVKSVACVPGYEQYSLGYDLEVLVVEDPLYVAPALAKLRATMTDPYVSLDLEWRPEQARGQRPSPVALMQLSSATTAVLVRTCRMQHKLPQALRSFLADPAITLVGFGWHGSDEAKMQQTFGGGAATMFAPSFLDLRTIAEGLGYHGHGLQRLARAVLGVDMPKAKSVTMSNWEQRVLSTKQVRYAALDVLVCGQVLRGLRLWHSVGATPCSACLQPLGQLPSTARPRFVCAEDGCGKSMADIRSYLNHCSQTGHAPLWQECGSCSRVCRVPCGAGASLDDDAAASELQLAL